MKEFIAQTAPAVNIPSKKNVKYPVSKYSFVNPPNVKERKNPTHVGIHNIQVMNSYQNDDFFNIHRRGLSKIPPDVIIVDIP